VSYEGRGVIPLGFPKLLVSLGGQAACPNGFEATHTHPDRCKDLSRAALQ